MSRWNKKTITEAFYKCKKQLGRVPTYEEFDKGNGTCSAICRGSYSPNIRTYNGFLADIGEDANNERNIWNKDTILGAYFELNEKLGRNPTSVEFTKRYSGASDAITGGRYDPKITTWNGFLIDIKQPVTRDRKKWNKESVKNAFFSLKEKLGRAPAQREFMRWRSGAIYAINNGRYDPKVSCWNEFLQDIKEEVTHEMGKWHRATIIDAFYTLKKKLGRAPKAFEFSRAYSGGYHAITNKQYDPSITQWNDFLADIGEKINGRKNNSNITNLLEEIALVEGGGK